MNLRRKIFVRNAGLLAALVVFICGSTLLAVRSRARQHSQRDGKVDAAHLAERCRTLLAWKDLIEIHSEFTEAIKDDAASYVWLEQNGRIIAHTFRAGLPRGLLTLHPAQPAETSIRQWQDERGRVFYDIAAPVDSHDAVVHLGLSQAAVDARTSGLSAQIVLAGTIVILLGTGLSYGIAALTTREIDAVTAELRTSEAKYRNLFERSRDALMTVEPPSWKFTAGNPAMIDMFQLGDARELTTIEPSDLSPERQPDGRASGEKAQEMIETAMREGSHFFEWTHKRIDGQEFPATVLLTRVEQAGKTIIQATVRDITAQKRADETLRALKQAAEAREMQYEQVVSMIGDVVWRFEVDARGQFVSSYISPVADRLFDLPAGTIGHDFDKWFPYVHPDDLPTVQEALHAGIRTLAKNASVEYRVRKSDSTVAWHRTKGSAYPLAEGRVAAFGTTTDITAQKDAEEIRLQAERQRERCAVLESANQALEELNRLAESATRAKCEFLANMSHEIRTPLTAILGFSDLVAESIDCCDKCPVCATCETRATNRQHMQVIRRNGEHLLRLINDILDLSKVEAGKMQIEPTRCSPFELVVEVASLMRVRAQAKQLTLDVEFAGPLPETVFADPLRLRQVLVNLVGNAIKFTDQGRVRITARLTHGSGAPRLSLDVTDTGIGMNEEQVGKLFQTFTQVDGSAARKFGGTGLGLCLSKGLIEAMGGNIEVRSVPGKGSTFSVTIDPGPLDRIPMVQHSRESVIQPQPAAAPADSIKAVLHGRILLAEDGPDNQRLIAFLLKKAGAEVTLVEDGQVAYDEALAARDRGRPFDAILMDMQMPVMDGYEAARRLRAEGYAGPIIALTAHAMPEDRLKCLEAGCDDYAAKPIDANRLIDMMVGFTKQRGEKSGVPQRPELIYSSLAADLDLRELVDMFVQEMPGRISALQAQADARNWEQLARTAHQLKGSAGSYGFREITPCAARLELAARDARQEGQILAALDELLSLCRRARSGTPPADQSAPSAPPQIA